MTFVSEASAAENQLFRHRHILIRNVNQGLAYFTSPITFLGLLPYACHMTIFMLM